MGLVVIEPFTPSPSAASSTAAVPSSTGQRGFKVWLLAARSVQELMAIHLAASEWDEALQLAKAYRLYADEVYRYRWGVQRGVRRWAQQGWAWSSPRDVGGSGPLVPHAALQTVRVSTLTV